MPLRPNGSFLVAFASDNYFKGWTHQAQDIIFLNLILKLDVQENNNKIRYHSPLYPFQELLHAVFVVVCCLLVVIDDFTG
jgi:hypothetical protein